MLNSELKRKIDTARDILVGKIPDPKAQVEQITTALIYKFMDDMDKEAVELGGKARFFTRDYQKYSWTKLMDPRLGGIDRLNLYSEAITSLNQNPHIPQLFRDIFKDAFLPYRNPETLNLFLKEINGFMYEHSEDLGDAYEYLLSVLGSQGDAGQFRTPRHIINFIVSAVDPNKDDKVLDPACGTAGFLISAYKNILRKHDGLDDVYGFPTDKETSLTPDERKTLINNFVGYDISPDMVKISKVNMYLHGFPNPTIYEYDALSSEDRWDEMYDVILANPPFMTPKGGIRPHKRFSVQANRSEVLFVDYILEHLKINGRAGIIVPEGIIFQSANAYKQLRKLLVDDGLLAVVSLPAGVFNPYSGVKTCVLIFDEALSKRTKDILFLKISNDGFDLGAQRKQIDKNDLPQGLEIIKRFRKYLKENKQFTLFENDLQIALLVTKQKILESGDYNLTGDRYKDVLILKNQKWPMVALDEVLNYEQPTNYIVSTEDYNDNYKTPVLTAGKTFILGYTNEKGGIFEDNLPVIIFDDFTTATKFVNFPFKVKSSAMKILHAKGQGNIKFLFYIMQKINFPSSTHKRYWISQYSKIKIPLPPLEVQEQIAQELDGYQKIITGAKQIVANWKPTFVVDSNWELTALSDETDFQEGPGILAVDFKESGIPLIRLKGLDANMASKEGCNFLDPIKVKAKWHHFRLQQGDLLLSTSGSLGRVSEVDSDLVDCIVYTGIIRFRPKNDNLDAHYLKYFLMSDFFIKQAQSMTTGVVLKHFGPSHLNKMKIIVPPIKVQKQIVEKIEAERALVESAKKLIEIYEQKIKDKIAEVWGK